MATTKRVKTLSKVDAQYLQEYLLLCEKVVKAGPLALEDEEFDEMDPVTGQYKYWSEESPFVTELKELNDRFKAAGVSSKLLRKKFVAQDALTGTGSWYNSSIGC